ncbi:MAG: hypothetical protein ACPGOV_14455 [Magnetovibrionaceae bacterium]
MINRRSLLLVGAVFALANAFINPVQQSVLSEGYVDAALQAFGLNGVVLGAAALGLTALARSRDETRADALDWIFAFILMALLLVPLATAAWVGLAAYMAASLAHLRQGISPWGRAGCLILLSLGLREPVSRMLFSFFGEGVLTFDALATAAALKIIGQAALTQGNMITGGSGHELLVLSGCSSFRNLSFVLLAWFALSRFLVVRAGVRSGSRPDWIVGAGLFVAMIGVNVARLAVMAQGPEAYQFFHDGPGTQVFEGAQVLLVGGGVYATLALSKRNGFDPAGRTGPDQPRPQTAEHCSNA